MEVTKRKCKVKKNNNKTIVIYVEMYIKQQLGHEQEIVKAEKIAVKFPKYADH